jgi:hypothetical protein
MKHYIKPDGSVWAFESDGSQDHLITDDMTAISDEALAALRAPSLEQQRTDAARKIDADADRIYGDVLGNRGEEYKAAEADAKTFKAVGYSGNAPAGVSSWVAASGMTAQGAADDILTTAENWRGAMSQIRANRLLRKKEVERAADQEEISAALIAWGYFVSVMRSGLGL